MNIYSADDIARIEKTKQANEKYELFFEQKRDQWNKNLEPLFKLMSENFNLSKVNLIIEAQANALSYRQAINEEISFFLNKRSKEDIKLKNLREQKFIFCAVSLGLKTNLGEKSILIDSLLSHNIRTVELYDLHIEYLRENIKSLESLQYAIKNMISLLEYLKS